MGSKHLFLLLSCVLAAPLPGGEPSGIEDKLAPAAKKLAAKAKGKKILLVFSEDANPPEKWRVLGKLRDRMLDSLQSEGVAAVVSPEVEDLLHRRRKDAKAKPLEESDLRKLAAFDGLLVGNYQRRKGSRSLRMTLNDGAKGLKLWDGAVAFHEGDVGIERYLPDLNRKILDFAALKKGKKVGNGECWTLAAEALSQAGAVTKDNYEFGRLLGPRDPIFPGDVMQFEKVKFKGAQSLTFPHHTALVFEVLGSEVLTIAHQNHDSVKSVTLLTLDLRDLSEGSLQIFRPEGERRPDAEAPQDPESEDEEVR